jgi:DMSO/TMAO reductase YedYZ molybdopterin-dependent catalytic subunit
MIGEVKNMANEVVITSPDTLRNKRIPPNQRQVKDWPVLHSGGVRRIKSEKWSFSIFGLVETSRKLNYNEFSSLPMVKVFSDIHCVTGWSRLDNLWEGVSTGEIRNLVKIKPEAKFVMVHGDGGFTTNLPIDDFFAEDALFALKHDNEPVNADHGGPVRLIVPRLYFWKSAKWATGVEFMTVNKPGFWESNGYHIHGDPWTEERYS